MAVNLTQPFSRVFDALNEVFEERGAQLVLEKRNDVTRTYEPIPDVEPIVKGWHRERKEGRDTDPNQWVFEITDRPELTAAVMREQLSAIQVFNGNTGVRYEVVPPPLPTQEPRIWRVEATEVATVSA